VQVKLPENFLARKIFLYTSTYFMYLIVKKCFKLAIKFDDEK